MIPNGLCVDLETTLSSKIPDSVRPPGLKRYETRIIEIGAVLWKSPAIRWGCIVNPVPKHIPIQSNKDFFEYLMSIYQNPTKTVNFWSRVLVKRKSLHRNMFLFKEEPEVWLARQVGHRTKDFVQWHNQPELGPNFLSEKTALKQLLSFTRKHNTNHWLAHNGNSFDFKVLKGCAERHNIVLPHDINMTDTLKLFRKYLPGHKSYSQPILYKNLFQKNYNAHVAIDDAIALSEICHHVSLKTIPTTIVNSKSFKKTTNHKVPMNLTFGAQQLTKK